MTDPLTPLATELGRRLAAAGLRLVTAESCTGGWIAKAVTDIAGSSAWFEVGLVTYSNEAKHGLLGVRTATLAAHGAVSEPVVAEMAVGARECCAPLPGSAGAAGPAGASRIVSVAVSGVAGPGGGSIAKPVGTVCFGFAVGGVVETRTCQFHGDRDAVRRQSVAYALSRLIELLAAAGDA